MKNIDINILHEAKIFGIAACLSDSDRIPARDDLLITLLDHVEMNQSVHVLKAWLIGWDYANLNKN